jgi:energy-coupling factor transporter ATP-binding protein EcfA2
MRFYPRNRNRPVPPALWDAILDFRSGRRFVWDTRLQKARAALPHETSGFLPTVTENEFAAWRRDFADSHRRGLSQSELRLLLRWQSDGKYLPRALQRAWNAELVSRVIARIEDYFAKQDLPSPVVNKPSRTRPFGAGAPLTTLPTKQPKPASLRSPAPAPPAPQSTEAADDELVAERWNAGDQLGLGEALVRKLKYVEQARVEGVLAKIVTAWASPIRLASDVASIQDLIERMYEFVPDDLGIALIHALARLRATRRPSPTSVGDLVFRLSKPMTGAFEIPEGPSSLAVSSRAVARLEQALASLRSAVTAFHATNTVTAKAASIDVLKSGRALTRMVLPSERAYLRELEVLLGAAFRKFCEGCERHDDAGVLRRASEIREHLSKSVPSATDPRAHSEFWKSFVQPLYRHVEALLDEGTKRSEIAASPSLALANAQLKLNLSGGGRQTAFSCRLLNSGDGRALQVTAEASTAPEQSLEFELLYPPQPFDVAAHSEQLVTVGLALTEASRRVELPLRFRCTTSTGQQRDFEDRLILEQQHEEPDWEKLLADPPYTLNPIKDHAHLFGRERILQDLQLHVASGTSTFLWGQKRVGKTSLLQVLAAELEKRSGSVCLVLRMGELVGMHEGQIARTIGHRLNERIGSPLNVPTEAEFGAGMGHLVPFVEQLLRGRPGRYVVIIDEFDDLDPAFYMGERGRQFVKALRSLSEVGVTFFFVGSERMDSIYRRHQADLNKWSNVSLNRIESIEDCKALVTRPVEGSIEYEAEAVRRIIDYCAGNPFYIQTVCFEVFKRCLQERRTFVGESDVIAVADTLIRALGPTNFAHFWEDNPELNTDERARQTAENCVVLTCLAALHGAYETVEELYDVQTKLGLSTGEQLSMETVKEVVNRLRRRGILTVNSEGSGVCVEPPIFRDWLNEYAEILLLRWWREFCARSTIQPEAVAPGVEVIEPAAFPISEDDLFSVSQRLVYCGKQKDVAEVRTWLRQFDDDTRIEVAFLLLRRMAEKGYVPEGERVLAMQRVEEVLKAPTAKGAPVVWQIIRNRTVNLCVSYVDSETKSGASTAREVAKLLRPGKCASAMDIGAWLQSHLDQEAILVFVDDFAGSGETMVKGLTRFTQHKAGGAAFRKFCQAGQVHVVLLFAFPEAVRAIRDQFPEINVTPIRVFGDDVRALEPEAGIFSNEGERRFAQDILRQIGQQLSRQYPLGHAHLGALVLFHNTVPNNTLPVFWSSGVVNERPWQPLFPRASWS